MKKPIYEIQLEPMPGNYNAPTVRRLAQVLKALGRQHGFKAISAVEKPCVCDICTDGQPKGSGGS